VEHLGTIAGSGLHCDSAAQANDLLAIEVGEARIKARRARRPVPVYPGGYVSDYAAFYFAPRSPMMRSIAGGNVPAYTGGTDQIAYLVTTIERLQQLDLNIVLTDRNAVLDYTEFACLRDGEPAEDFVDWPLMKQRYWFDTAEYPDRKERRMAECLVHQVVPWEAFTDVVLKSEAVAAPVRQFLAQGGHSPRVSVRPEWYF
jgi:hypothetical protein